MSLSWYWHRLRAMEPTEIAAHVRKKLYQWQDARRLPDWSGMSLEPTGGFPKLPRPEDAPTVLREALARDTRDILAGRWKAFGHLELRIDDPPQWHKDYLVGKNLATTGIAFKLNHRELPDGADIKLIWELSRWHQLTRLAMAACVLSDERAATKCVEWLEDWVNHNPPYRGWNWTSALEVGMRLVLFTWIDALLIGSSRREDAQISKSEIRNPKSEIDQSLLASAVTQTGLETRLSELRQKILPSHVWFAWRYRSFGSSANNHLIGELAGLILAVSRWPELAKWSAPLDTLQELWEREVLAQFAEDGGNKEQALNYHLFSWEFCWQSRAALAASGQTISCRADERLQRAARFFWEVQSRREHWDYGDSDNAHVTPFFASEGSCLIEWRDWIANSPQSKSVDYWIGAPPMQPRLLGTGQPLEAVEAGDWWIYRQSGIALCESGFWWLRWDVSPLGYLATAAHGHLDALHLSIWYRGVAIVVDPGTGAYYGDNDLRAWLAAREAHNGPCPLSVRFPKRDGPFLWSEHHAAPAVSRNGRHWVVVLPLPGRVASRSVQLSEDGQTWTVVDTCQSAKRVATVPFAVRWQFPPNSFIKHRGARGFVVRREGVEIEVQPGEEWTEVKLVETPSDREKLEPENSFGGIVSPAFRKTVFAPYLLLTARPDGDKPCVFRTTFLACRDS